MRQEGTGEDWVRGGSTEKARRQGGETGGEKGLLSDLIKGCDLNRYLIKWLLPHNACNSPCRQNHESEGLAACYITQLGFVHWSGTCVPEHRASEVMGL